VSKKKALQPFADVFSGVFQDIFKDSITVETVIKTKPTRKPRVNRSSPIRQRRTFEGMESMKSSILKVANEIREGGTITLRQLYYAMTVRKLLAKTETDYKRLAQITSLMRRSGAMPYDWIEDGTRVTYVRPTWADAQSALEALAQQYHESPWSDAEVVPEIWLEKDALAGIVYDETFQYCVPLRVQRGYASLSALYRAAKDIHARYSRGTGTIIYYLRDLDPSGADAARAAEETVLKMLLAMPSDAYPKFEILGVTREQVEKWNLPTRPNKTSDTRTAKYQHDISVELDAIPPQQLRDLVAGVIDEHLPDVTKAIHAAQVASTRRYLQGIAEGAA